jgi:hypothetical protein
VAARIAAAGIFAATQGRIYTHTRRFLNSYHDREV